MNNNDNERITELEERINEVMDENNRIHLECKRLRRALDEEYAKSGKLIRMNKELKNENEQLKHLNDTI